MPQDASALEREAYDRVLVLGEPHVGKSTSIVESAVRAFGPGYVINAGKKTGLLQASRQTAKFKFDIIRDEIQMEAALKEARRGAKEGEYKWIFWDDANLYASWLETVLEDGTRNAKGEADGRRWWRDHRKRVMSILIRFFDVRAHFYCACHYIETGGTIEGQTEKTGYGVAPLFGGALRKEFPGYFADVVFMSPATKRKGEDNSGRRSFFINPVGVFGPSCLSSSETLEIDADVGQLHEAFKKSSKAQASATKSRR